MDFINKATGGDDSNNKGSDKKEESGGFMDSINGMAGGGKQGEKNEDGVDKAIDFVQEKFLGGGDQSNETAAEQAKDEAISDYVRDTYKGAVGSDIPIEDKDKKYGS